MLERMEESARQLSRDDIRRVESIMGIRLPKEYAVFLLKHNGGRPIPNGFPIDGLANNPFGMIHFFLGIDNPVEVCNIDWSYEVLNGRIPSNLLPIADDPGGNAICLSLFGDDAGAVVFWDHAAEHLPPTYANIYRIADSFTEFIESLCDLQAENEIEHTIRTGTIEEVKALAERAQQEKDFPESLDILAAMHGRTEVLEYLIHAGFRSPELVMVAAQNGHAETVYMLAKLGCDLNVQDETGKTPLMLAVAFRHMATIKTLLTLGAKMDISDKYGNTAISKAVSMGSEEIIAMIEKAKADRGYS
jgi:hypothetical protein